MRPMRIEMKTRLARSESAGRMAVTVGAAVDVMFSVCG